MHLSRALVLVSVLLAGSGQAPAQSPTTISSVDSDNDGRPVSALIGPFRQSEGIAISYEDPRYRNAEDMQDVTEQVRPAGTDEDKNGSRTLVPKGPPMTFVYTPSPRNVTAAYASIQRMVEEYDGLGGPSFRAFRTNERIFVVPHDVRDEKGNRVVEGSILETRISLPAKQRSGNELLTALCEAVERASGFRIDIGTGAPTNALLHYRTSEAFGDQTARAILVKLLDGLSQAADVCLGFVLRPRRKCVCLKFCLCGKPASYPVSALTCEGCAPAGRPNVLNGLPIHRRGRVPSLKTGY